MVKKAPSAYNFGMQILTLYDVSVQVKSDHDSLLFIINEKLLLLRKDNNEVDFNVSVGFAFLNFY